MKCEVKYGIFKNEDGYLVTKITSYGDIVESSVVFTTNSLDMAEEFLSEEGIPGNSAGGGNVAGIGIGVDGEPPAPLCATTNKKKSPRNPLLARLLRRLKPMMTIPTPPTTVR